MKIILLIILITIICHCNVSSQSLWQTTAIPFTSVNQQINDISFVTADIGYVNVCNHTSNVFNQITIYKTTDKGFNWISKGNIGINVYSITNPAMEFIKFQRNIFKHHLLLISKKRGKWVLIKKFY